MSKKALRVMEEIVKVKGEKIPESKVKAIFGQIAVLSNSVEREELFQELADRIGLIRIDSGLGFTCERVVFA